MLLVSLHLPPQSFRRDALSTETVHTEPLWPLNVPRRSPLDVNQTLTILSLDAEKRRSPSVLKTIWVSERSCPVRRQLLISSFMFNISTSRVRKAPRTRGKRTLKNNGLLRRALACLRRAQVCCSPCCKDFWVVYVVVRCTIDDRWPTPPQLLQPRKFTVL